MTSHPTPIAIGASLVHAAPRAVRLVLLGTALLVQPGCSLFTRIAEVGSVPSLAGIEDPHARPGYTPVSLPMPTPLPAERNPNSLWRHGARAFFDDQRANQVGDILTVAIQIDDRASLQNQTSRGRQATEKAGLPNFLGLENYLGADDQGILGFRAPLDPSSLISANSDTASDGTGAIRRNEQIELRVAALITQVLPNGNFVIQGKQEVRVNFELRELTITGVIRPEDITARNEITYDKIAEARISYGGRGQVMDMQQPRWGQQVYDIVWPW